MSLALPPPARGRIGGGLRPHAFRGPVQSPPALAVCGVTPPEPRKNFGHYCAALKCAAAVSDASIHAEIMSLIFTARSFDWLSRWTEFNTTFKLAAEPTNVDRNGCNRRA